MNATFTLTDAVSAAQGFKDFGVSRSTALRSMTKFGGDAEVALKQIYDGIEPAPSVLVWETPAHQEVPLHELNPQRAKAGKTAPVTFFESIALPLVERLNVPIAPCYPKDKQVHTKLVPSPLTMMSQDPAQIRAWGQAEPNANVCVYAQQVEGGLCFVDKDGAVSLRAKYEEETGKPFPKTLLVRSSVIDDGKGGTITKGHWYFRQTPKTLALSGNISEDKTGGLFSFRVKNFYVTSIGSIHPKTGMPYEVAEDYPVIPIHDDFVDWLLAQVKEQPKTREKMEKQEKIPEGQRYTSLISYLGKLHHAGTPREQLIESGIAWAEKWYDVPEGMFNPKRVRARIEHFIDHGYEQKLPASGVALALGSQQPTPGSADQQLTVDYWPEPQPAGDKLSPVPTFDLAFLPDAYKPWITDIAERMSVPLDFPAIAAFTITAGVIGRRAFIYPKRFDKEWREPLNISGAVVASSGAVKTPTWKALLAPVIELEMFWENEYKAKYAQYLEEHEAWELAEKRKSEKKVKKVDLNKGKEPQQQPQEPVVSFPEPLAPLPPRRLLVTDSTPEKMHMIMDENPEGILFYRDELTSWASELEKKGYESARGMHLAATNGNDYFAMDRVERGTVKAIMCETIFGSFQPEIFRDFLSNATNLNDGMVPRFPLLVWPDPIERVRVDKKANDVAKGIYNRVVQRFAKSKAEHIQIHFTPGAQNIYDKWFDSLMSRINEEKNEAKKSYLSKMTGGLARIAGLFHLIDVAASDGQTGPIAGIQQVGETHVVKAIQFSAYLEKQMHRVYDSIRTNVQIAEAELVGRMKAGELTGCFTLRDIHRKRWHGLTKPDDVESALDTLEAKGWVRSGEDFKTKTRGRPTVRWQVSPKVEVDAF